MDGADRFSAGLIVRLPDGEREVNAECDQRAPAGGLVDAILEHVGLPADGDLYVARTGRPLDRNEPLESQPLAHGDVLLTFPPPPDEEAHARSGAYLIGAGGAAIGGRWPLGAGPQRVGRSRDCEIVVDDAALSRTHLLFEAEPGAVYLTDAGSTNGTFIEGIRVEGRRRLAPGDVIEAGASLFIVEPSRTSIPRSAPPEADGTIRFNRPPRVTPVPDRSPIVVPAPPADGPKPRLPLASAALPLVAAFVLWRLFPDNPSLLLIMALSPLMAIGSFVEERRKGRGAARAEVTGWRGSVAEALEQAARRREAAVQSERERAPGVGELEAAVERLTARLWQRRAADRDFLALRCGWGDRPWNAEFVLEPGGSDALRTEALARIEPLRTLPSVPLTVPLRDLGVVGLIGDLPRVSDLIRWWIVQVMTLHSPEEVTCVLLFPDDEAEEWSWTTWVPHFHNEPTEGRVRPALEQSNALLHLLEVRRSARTTSPDVVVFVDERAKLPRRLLSPLLREGPSHGIHLAWRGNRQEDLPGECAGILEIHEHDAVSLTLAASGETISGAFEGIGSDRARRIATAIAPVRDAAPRSPARDLPTRVDLFDVLGASQPNTAWVASRWRASKRALRAPIGTSPAGIYTLDLIGDGPHALVGGTTGSGKSELLQTIVASLAASYPPTELNFLLVDYKGGAAFKDCARLPHAVGSVTDLDPRLAERALLSLDAEVRRREALLRDAGARDVRELPDSESPPLARLVLVVDEFATLIKELPAFVDGVVDLAQRGRSLGIHVILATQRPAGAINDAIRANTNLRVALRVADEADSEDVIGIRAAAHIPRTIPGRAYARKGHAEVDEIQCAFGGSTRVAGNRSAQVWDRASAAPAGGEEGSDPTQLEQLVAAVRAAAESEGHPVPRRPWLPPLPDAISLDGLEREGGGDPGTAAIGLTDLPEQQRREVVTFDPGRDGGMLVFGTGRSGKTTVLRTIAAALATSTSADRVHLYAIDYAGPALGALSALPHVGDVVFGNEPERVERLFHMLRAEIDRRKRAPAGTDTARPTIVVLLDGYAGFGAAFERIDMGALVDGFPTLLNEGRSVGIHFVITAERRAAVPQALAASLGRRLILRMSDPDEYAALGLDARRLRGTRLPPGRGFIDGAETQIATLSGSASGGEDDEALRRLAETLPPAASAPPEVRLLPSEVELSTLPKPDGPFRGVLGLVLAEDLAPAVVDLGPAHFLAAGPYRSGRSTALAALASSLLAGAPEATFHLLAPRKTPLRDLTMWARVAEGAQACAEEIESLAAAVTDSPDAPRVVVIDDAEEILEGPASYALEALIRRARDGSTRFVVAGEIKALQRAFTGWVTEIRKDKQGLLLDPDTEVDGDLLGVRLPRRKPSQAIVGRGYLIRRGAAEQIQVARP